MSDPSSSESGNRQRAIARLEHLRRSGVKRIRRPAASAPSSVETAGSSETGLSSAAANPRPIAPVAAAARPAAAAAAPRSAPAVIPVKLNLYGGDLAKPGAEDKS